jgi:hypothetical protein
LAWLPSVLLCNILLEHALQLRTIYQGGHPWSLGASVLLAICLKVIVLGLATSVVGYVRAMGERGKYVTWTLLPLALWILTILAPLLPLDPGVRRVLVWVEPVWLGTLLVIVRRLSQSSTTIWPNGGGRVISRTP